MGVKCGSFEFVALGEVGAADDENEDDCYSRGEQETDIHSSPEQSPASIRSQLPPADPPSPTHSRSRSPHVLSSGRTSTPTCSRGSTRGRRGSRRGGTATVEEPAEEQWCEHHQIFLLLVSADM